MLVTGAYSTVTNWLNSGKIATASAGALALTGTDSEAISMGSYASLSLGASGADYSGTLTPSGSIYRLGGGGGTLTLTSALTGTSPSRSLVVTGPGTVNLTSTGDNYTGGTTVNGGLLEFGSTGAIPSSGNITINSGGAVLVASALHTGDRLAQ